MGPKLIKMKYITFNACKSTFYLNLLSYFKEELEDETEDVLDLPIAYCFMYALCAKNALKGDYSL
jgi:hypothetical protein